MKKELKRKFLLMVLVDVVVILIFFIIIFVRFKPADSTPPVNSAPPVEEEINVQETEGEMVEFSQPLIVKKKWYNIIRQKVTYDCVWFGSYPQAEIISQDMEKDYAAIESKYIEEGDLLVDTALYTQLQNSTDWDANGDITLDGKKYRRMRKADASCSAVAERSSYYRRYVWSDNTTYHYFLYEPIKWRILWIDDTRALLLSDKVLDEQQCISSVTWKTNTLRSWLNGYGSLENNYGRDYSNNNFIHSAFTSEEENAIVDTVTYRRGVEEDGQTVDKLFLLSVADVILKKHGFVYHSENDKARRAKSSTYAKAMGVDWHRYSVFGRTYRCSGCSDWWLRAPGKNKDFWMGVSSDGYVSSDGTYIPNTSGVRVGLYLDLTFTDFYSYAGTVCSNGAKYEVKAEKR